MNQSGNSKVTAYQLSLTVLTAKHADGLTAN